MTGSVRVLCYDKDVLERQMIKKGEKKMIQMTKEEAEALLRKLRILRRESGEMIAFLEHLMQTQNMLLGLEMY